MKAIDKVPVDFNDMVSPDATVLIMWDFQVGLGGKAVNKESLLDAARRLLSAADDAGVHVIWSRSYKPPASQISPGALYRLMKKQGVSSLDDLSTSMEPGSAEWQYMPEIGPRDGDTIIPKMTPSFFVGTSLELRLHSMGIRTLVLAGVATEIGIDLTAKHAFALGFFPVVAGDAVSSYTQENHDVGLAALKTWVPIVESAELAAMWRQHADG